MIKILSRNMTGYPLLKLVSLIVLQSSESQLNYQFEK
jgi:hypothetical protein